MFSSALIKLFVFTHCLHMVLVSGQETKFPYSKLFNEQVQIYGLVKPKADDSCSIEQQLDYTMFLICPTEENCYVKTYLKGNNPIATEYLYEANLDDECVIKSGVPFFLEKIDQLNAVIGMLRLSKETMCEFSVIETLDAQNNGLANVGQLGGSGCGSDECPYQLKYLKLSSNRIDYLSNNSFCRFEQLEFLAMADCGLKEVEEGAFVDLVNLKELFLNWNNLSCLPLNLFANNVNLQRTNLRDNRLRTNDFIAFASIASLQYLFFDNNEIELASAQLTDSSSLVQLFVSGNRIKEVYVALLDFLNLEVLVLSNNSLTEIDEIEFQDLLSVTYIDLKNNDIKTLHPGTFRNTLKLETLFLSNNRLDRFPPVAHLSSLKQLYARGNRIRLVAEADLINCTRLTDIDLSDNQLFHVESGAFSHIKQLKTLNLANNRLTEFTSDFKNSNIVQLNLAFNNFTTFAFKMFPPSLTNLVLILNQIVTIEAFEFGDGAAEWKLTVLDLSSNRIDSIENLKLPNAIIELDLRDNRIREFMPQFQLHNPQLLNLRSVFLQYNSISGLCYASYKYFPSFFPIQMYVSGNPLECTCENLWIKYPRNYNNFAIADLNQVNCKQRSIFNDSYYQLSALKDSQFVCESNYFNSNRCKCPPQNSLQCPLPCPTKCTCQSDFNISSIIYNCNDSDFQQFPNDMNYYTTVYNVSSYSLYLYNNNISCVTSIDFGNSTSKLTELKLSNVNAWSIDEHAFDRLINLKVLDLSGNLLEVLPDHMLIKLTRLTELSLSDNRLRYLADETFTSLTNLNILYLHNNRFTQFPINQLAELKLLNYVTLYHNPWSCQCAYLKAFRAYLSAPLTPVYKSNELNCTENGSDFNVLAFNMELCASQINLTIVIPTLTLGTVLIIITAGLVFKWRYELQVLVYSRYGLRMFHRRQSEEDECKQFDAFMAYNSKDEDFLVEQLLPGLEGIENPYRILIHERDFLAGGFIQDNILEAIKISSRTIIVLTENFVQSGWCRFEFKTAHVQMMEDRCPRLLVIVVGEIPQTLDQEMQLYLKTNTYLKWGERLFWQKLYYTMPDLRVTTPPTSIIPI